LAKIDKEKLEERIQRAALAREENLKAIQQKVEAKREQHLLYGEKRSDIEVAKLVVAIEKTESRLIRAEENQASLLLEKVHKGKKLGGESVLAARERKLELEKEIEESKSQWANPTEE